MAARAMAASNGEGGRRLTVTRVMATVTAMTWVTATVTWLGGDKEGKGEGGKGDDSGDDGGGRRATKRQEWRRRQEQWRCDNGGRQVMAMATKRVRSIVVLRTLT